ncbi:MAG: hypothetical protein HQ495_15050 [Alphaproteobacteria bacterium]|nr:hypothetical protein [Alphaproteobacteria bacterium]
MSFDAFVGIDWSGAKGTRHRGIQIALCKPGVAAPHVVPPTAGAWSRSAVLDWLVDASKVRRILAGLDFSFTLPYVDRGAYFPGVAQSPEDARSLWALVDAAAADDADHYAGAFLRAHPWAAYFHAPGAKGMRFSRRHKVVEAACARQGLGHPETIFHLIGPKQVGLGSLAGMRFLAALRREAPTIRIWPFDARGNRRSTVVEVFPRAFLQAAGHGPTKIRSVIDLNQALRAFDTEPMTLRGTVDDNVADAVITAAALRSMAGDAALWRPRAMDARVRHTEGWIFGVR